MLQGTALLGGHEVAPRYERHRPEQTALSDCGTTLPACRRRKVPA